MAILFAFGSLGVFASEASSPVVSPKLKFLPKCPYSECSFTASVSFNIVGQTAGVTCTSTQASCEAAVVDVMRCIKSAKNKFLAVLGL